MDKRKKENIIMIGVLVAVIALVAGVTVWSLFRFSIITIPKPYEPKYIDIAYEDLGSAKYLDGTTVWVSIFASDGSGVWDFSKPEDCAFREELLGYYPIAAGWLSEQGARYGKKLDFVYAENAEDTLLYYETAFDAELLASKEYKQTRKVASDEWFYIDENVDTDAIYEKYGDVNIVYSFFLNTPDDYYDTAMAFMAVDEALAYPYEMIWIPRNSATPATVAHETLHTFGAGDLYADDGYRISYYAPMNFPDYCKEHYPRDIMLTTADPDTGERYHDRITGEITDVTAYYIGWINNAMFDVDGFKMRHSQFEKKGGLAE